jgi:hypothetical protein
MLLFFLDRNKMHVYAYHPRRNKWEAMPPAYPQPTYHSIDAVYDRDNNVTLFTGGWEFGHSGTVEARETWAYRYKQKNRKGRLNPLPFKVQCHLSADRQATLSWQGPKSFKVREYAIYRGAGSIPWHVKMKQVGKTKSKRFKDTSRLKRGMNYFYRVIARGKKGSLPVASYMARTQTLPVTEVFLARQKDGSVQIAWNPEGSDNIVGYNIYRASAGAGNLWKRPFTLRDEGALEGKWTKLNEAPVPGTGYIDRLQKPAEAAHESQWMPFFLYRIHGVNRLGGESGASPVTMSIPSWPGPVLAVQQEDGAYMVFAQKRSKSLVRGSHLYRMDTYKNDQIFRSRGAPFTGEVFIDRNEWPCGDRRAYFVIVRDNLGQMGVPSGIVWARNMP